jgi:hypothetical protein
MTFWDQPHTLIGGRWLPSTAIGRAIVERQRRRGNPYLAPWTEGA